MEGEGEFMREEVLIYEKIKEWIWNRIKIQNSCKIKTFEVKALNMCQSAILYNYLCPSSKNLWNLFKLLKAPYITNEISTYVPPFSYHLIPYYRNLSEKSFSLFKSNSSTIFKFQNILKDILCKSKPRIYFPPPPLT